MSEDGWVSGMCEVCHAVELCEHLNDVGVDFGPTGDGLSNLNIQLFDEHVNRVERPIKELGECLDAGHQRRPREEIKLIDVHRHEKDAWQV